MGSITSMSITKKAQMHGFTIVELLIVIVVIAILTAISVVAYNGIQDRAMDSTIKSEMATFDKKMKLAGVDSDNSGYVAPTNIRMQVTKSMYKIGRNNWYVCIRADGSEYALGVISDKLKGYYMTSYDGLTENVSVNWSNTCTKAGPTASSGGGGYNWNTTTETGGWASWID